MQVGHESQIQKILACYKCGKAFPHVEGIANHLKLIHNACITPDCKNIPDLNLHCLTCPNRRLNCIVCHKTFKDKNIFLTHFNQHIDVALFICEICREGFQLRKLLHKHLFEAHEDKEGIMPEIPARSKALYQKCSHCSKYFKLLSEYEEHKSICNSAKLICHICDVNFLTSELLESHRKLEHNSGKPALGHKALKEGKRYFCGLCYLGFFGGSILRLHLDTHNAPDFKCDVCYSSFGSDEELQEHYLLHIEEHYVMQDVIRQYSCTTCKRTFKNQLLLQNHMKFDACSQKGPADGTTDGNPDGNNGTDVDASGQEMDASDIPVYIYKSGDELLNCDDNNCVIVIDHKSVFVFQRGMCAKEDRMPDLSNSEAYKEDDQIDASLLNNHMLQVLYPPTAASEMVTSEVTAVQQEPVVEENAEAAKDAVMDASGGESVDNDMLQEIYDAVLRA